jgi:hypothetical protein
MRRVSPLAVAILLLGLCLGGLAQTESPRREVIGAGSFCRTQCGAPLWSPLGDRLAFTEDLVVGSAGQGTIAQHSLRVVSVDGSFVELLGSSESATDAPDSNDSPIDACWSPDGLHLAYIAEDPTTPEMGDLAISRLGGLKPEHATRGGGYYNPKWLQEVDADRFLILRDANTRAGASTSLLLLSPRATDPAEVARPLAVWDRDAGGIDSVTYSPSGALALVTASIRAEGRETLALGILRLRTADGWTATPVEPQYFTLPDTIGRVASPRWAPDENRVLFLAKGQRELTWKPWVLDVTTGVPQALSRGTEPGFYGCAEWADRGAAVLGLYIPGVGEGRPPSLRMVPLDGSRPTTLEPGWDPLVLETGVELAGDASGTLFALCSGAEIRMLQLGTKDEAAKRTSARNLRTLGQALVKWANANKWAPAVSPNAPPPVLLPDPTSEVCKTSDLTKGVDWKSDGFWVDLARDALRGPTAAEFEELLWCPGAAHQGHRSSYIMPPAAYGLDVGALARESEGTIILEERTGTHPDGHYVLKWHPLYADQLEVVWVPAEPTE